MDIGESSVSHQRAKINLNDSSLKWIVPYEGQKHLVLGTSVSPSLTSWAKAFPNSAVLLSSDPRQLLLLNIPWADDLKITLIGGVGSVEPAYRAFCDFHFLCGRSVDFIFANSLPAVPTAPSREQIIHAQSVLKRQEMAAAAASQGQMN